MDVQPNIGRLTEAFTLSSRALADVSHEIAHVVNLPAFNNGQHIVEAIERLTTSINTLRTDVTTLRTDMNSRFTNMNTDMNSRFTNMNTDMNRRFANMNTDMNRRFDSLDRRLGAESAYFSPFSNFIIIIFYSSLNHTARVYNSHISSRETPLHPLHDQHNMAVEGFPRDSASLMRLSSQTKSHIEKLCHQTNIMAGNTLTTLLDAFQLSADGNLETRKRRFREFVGLVVDA